MEQQDDPDLVYQFGYERIPEDADMGEAQVAVLDEVWPMESW